jgi:uroporphyrinogen decarboxylase
MSVLAGFRHWMEAFVKPRERVLAALRRQAVDRVPRYMPWVGEAHERLGLADHDAFLDHFGCEVRVVRPEPLPREQEFEEYLKSLPADIHIGNLEQLRTYFEWAYDPTRPSDAWLEKAIEQHLPDIAASERYQGLAEKVDAYHSRDLAVLGAPPRLGGVLFEASWRIRGFNQTLQDAVAAPERVEWLFGRLTEMACAAAVRVAQAGVDILALNDDVGTPTAMLVSPSLWRQSFKGRLSLMIKAARGVSPDLIIYYHSDGQIEPIILDLAEIGVQVIQPVQPDVMDPARLKRLYGDRMAFWGTVGDARLFCDGTPQQVRAEVRERIETVGPTGLVIAPAYDMDLPDVRWENVLAFFSAADDFGRVTT